MRRKGSDTSKLTRGVVPRLPKAPGCGRKPLKEHPWFLDEPLSVSFGILSYLVISCLNGVNLCCATLSKTGVCLCRGPGCFLTCIVNDKLHPLHPNHCWDKNAIGQNWNHCSNQDENLTTLLCCNKHQQIGEDLGRNSTGIGSTWLHRLYRFEWWEDRAKSSS